ESRAIGCPMLSLDQERTPFETRLHRFLPDEGLRLARAHPHPTFPFPCPDEGGELRHRRALLLVRLRPGDRHYRHEQQSSEQETKEHGQTSQSVSRGGRRK